jgi:hypothetical protein
VVTIKRALTGVGILAFALLLVAAGSLVASSRSTTGASVAALARCHDTQLAVTGVEASGAAVSGGWIIRYRNVGATACWLTGYPNVVGMNFATGESRAAAHLRSGYLGGWMGYANGKVKPLPVVVLRARDGVASSMVQWVSGPTAQTSGCFVLTWLWVNVPGGTRPFALKAWTLVCAHFDADPIVPGVRGSAS